MAVSSGQTAAQTQERGPEELHSAGPGQAGRGRGGPPSLDSRRVSRQRSQHGARSSGPSAARLRLLGRRRPTPRPAPAPPGARLPGAWGLGRWRRGGQGGGERSAHLCSVNLLGAVFAHSWVRVKLCGSVSRAQSRAGEGNAFHMRVCELTGAWLATRRADLGGCEVVDRSRTFPSLVRPGSGARVPTLSSYPPPSRTLCSAAPPHTRGCLFLLGLSMLSLFGRLCHRLDAGNKVRPCV